eukprot:1156987-Pelagomonas_calceolata.AAC.6
MDSRAFGGKGRKNMPAEHASSQWIRMQSHAVMCSQWGQVGACQAADKLLEHAGSQESMLTASGSACGHMQSEGAGRSVPGRGKISGACWQSGEHASIASSSQWIRMRSHAVSGGRKEHAR